MLVILDDGASGRRIYRNPGTIVSADTAGEVPGALDAIERALAAGRHAAGWFAYELGYALEPRLARLAPDRAPLLRVGIFENQSDIATQPQGRAYAGPLAHEWDGRAYAQRCARIKDYIAAGDVYQANLSFRAHFSFLGDPLALYEQLRIESGAGYCGYVDDGERQILSLSPELFFEIEPTGVITSRPMKGTAPREADDDAARARLLASAKNRAENLMIVDLIRNDLGRIADIGSVAVERLFEVQTYPTLHTMVSTVRAHKRSRAGMADVMRALFPCGSITGAPKIRAMEILSELEVSRRGAYCGAVGYFAPDGSARLNVAIRTLTIADSRGELGIGGGIVQDSEIPEEYAECLLKARFFEAARRPLELIETLRFENGFVRLESHLTRMANSAAALGLAFDRERARAALTEAVRGMAAPLRVRLTLDEAGTHKASAVMLPPAPSAWRYKISGKRVKSTDLLLRHKTSWRELYDGEAAASDVDEVIFLNERGEITEGARSNVFVRRGDVLLTPPLGAGLLDGRLRAELIAQGGAREAILTPEDLRGEIFFGNSLRGLIPARSDISIRAEA